MALALLHPIIALQLLLSVSLICGKSIITHLPGFSGPLPFLLETGYVEVEEVNGVELFYYFVESEGSPTDDPLLLWLSGGPGCSAFSGVVYEIGPLNFRSTKYNGSLPTLLYKPYSWTKAANVIFLDSPVGSGFSFSREPEGYEVGDITSSKQVHKFLRKWFADHPKFLPNPLYIAGDSYAGKFVPVIAQYIAEGNDAGKNPFLNLKGYIIGNPLTGEKFDFNSRIPYAHGVGIISDELYELTKRNCEGEDHRYPSNVQCTLNLEVVNKFLSELWMDHILEPKCAKALAKPKRTTGSKRSLKNNFIKLLTPPPLPDVWCRSYAYYLSYYWANDYLTREALHIKKGTVKEWQRCNNDLNYSYDIPSSIKYHLNLTTRGYRALVYSGDHDMLVPFLGTQEWIRSLNFPIIDDWRSWHVAGQVAGYTRTYSNNLTFATVKGAGHTAPEYRPKECLAMLRRWTSFKPL